MELKHKPMELRGDLTEHRGTLHFSYDNVDCAVTHILELFYKIFNVNLHLPAPSYSCLRQSSFLLNRCSLFDFKSVSFTEMHDMHDYAIQCVSKWLVIQRPKY